MSNPPHPQLEQLIELGHQQIALLERIAAALEAAPQEAPNYTYDLADYSTFDWEGINALVKQADEHGATAVLWRGHLYTRRAPQNKYGAAVWFSRATGKSDDGENVQYTRLITFKEIAEAEPIPHKVAGLLKRRDSEEL